MAISSQPNEFKVIVTKMVFVLRRRMDAHSENLENRRKYQSELKNTITNEK